MKNVILIGLCLLSQSCFLLDGTGSTPKPESGPLPSFVNFPFRNEVNPGIVDEASGIAYSTSAEGGLWVIQDGNRPPELNLLSTSGDLVGKLALPFSNRDWEDMSKSLDPETQEPYLYVGEIGDNAEVYPTYKIYRFKEPQSLNEAVSSVETFEFVYGDNKSHDAETMMTAPNGDIYVITKREVNVNVFKLAYPQNTSTINTAEWLGSIPLWFLTGGDLSLDGTEILVKNYDVIFYWQLRENETIYEALSRSRDVSPSYQREPQGEAICFDTEAKGFYTLSERPESVKKPVTLNYHGKVEEN